MRTSNSPLAANVPRRLESISANGSTVPRTGESSSVKPCRAASSAGERRSQSASCSTKSAGSPGFSVSRTRVAASGNAYLRTSASASAQVVRSAAAGPLETAATPPTGTSTATSARARVTPAWCSARARPPPFSRERWARTQFISSMGAPLLRSARLTARTSSSERSGCGASASADPPPEMSSKTESRGVSERAAASSASPACSEPASGSGWPPRNTCAPSGAGASHGTTSKAPRAPCTPAHNSAATLPSPSTSCLPPGPGCGARPAATRASFPASSASSTSW